MRHRRTLLPIVFAASAACLIAQPSFAAPSADLPPARTVRIGEVAVSAGLADDFLLPEGKSRWDLTRLTIASSSMRSAEAQDGSARLVELTGAGAQDGVVYTDPAGGDAALRWVFPDRFEPMLHPGARETLQLFEERDGAAGRLLIEVETVGLGWVHLPSGPREVALQRALVLRRPEGSPGYFPDQLIHRWVDPLAGIVAEIRGRSSDDGRSRISTDSASIVEEVITGAADLKIHIGELWGTYFDSVFYGWDRGAGTTVSSLTTPSYSTIGALVGASTWDFSINGERRQITGTTTANNTTSVVGVGTQFVSELQIDDLISVSSAPTTYRRVVSRSDNTHLTTDASIGNGTVQNINRKSAEIGHTTTPINSSETCNSLQCGYTVAGGQLGRRDKNFGISSVLDKSNSVEEREDHTGDVTIWLRSGSQHEGKAGAFGTGESRFCYITFDSVTRTPVPDWVLRHNDNDGKGFYMQSSDAWSSGDADGDGTASPFNCEQNIYNEVCGGGGFLSKLYSKSCSGHTGTQYGRIIKGGVVTLPSGHTLNALLAKIVADFCVYTGPSCGFATDQVRTVNYIWQVPHLSTVVRLQSAQAVTDDTSWNTVAESDINFGLFPPRTITVTGTTNTSVSLSWDPGLDTHRISSYKIYWDTDSGGASSYAFNSVNNAGQVSFAGTTATVSGLTPGTRYYFTVTSRSVFTDPSTTVATTYESILYPTQVYGDPQSVYPIEVLGATTGGSCIPTVEAAGLTVTKVGGGNIQMCWSPIFSDPCLIGYRVLGANSPTSDGNFTPITDVGLTTCWTGNPSQSYFLVVARGTAGTGPWGHYGH